MIRGRSASIPGVPQKSVHLIPERPPGGPLGLGEFRQGVGVADARQVGVGLPVPQDLRDCGAGLGRAGLDEFRPEVALGFEPVEGLASELRLRGIVGRRVVLTHPGGGQGGGTGGLLKEQCPAVGAGLRVGRQRLGPEPDGGGVAFRIIAQSAEDQALGVVAGPVAPPKDPRQPFRQRRQVLGLLHPLRRGERPARPTRPQVMPLAELCQRPGVVAQLPEGMAEVERAST